MGNKDAHNGRLSRAAAALVAAFASPALATSARATGGVALAGPGSEASIAQPRGLWSAFIAGPDRSLVSTSPVDTALSFGADWSAWQASDGGVAEIVAAALTGEDRAVTAALGDLDAPALTLAASGGGWAVLPAGAFPANEPEPLAPPAATNAIRITLRAFSGNGGGRLAADTRADGGAWEHRPDLALSGLGWTLPVQNPAAWGAAGASLAGGGAALTELRLRVFRAPTLLLLR